MRHFGIVGTIGIVLGVMLAPAQVETQRRSSPGATTVERTLRVGGRDRTYLVHDFAGTSVPAPAVIVFHGGGGNAENAVRMTGFDRVAARERLVVVYPNGTSAGRARGRLGRMGRGQNQLLTWNARHCCASAMKEGVDDVGFVSAVIDALIASGRVDASRVYVTGMSNGAMLSHRLGRELSRKVAAIAPVVGALFGDEPPPQAPVPAFIIVGADDRVVPPQGDPFSCGPCSATSPRPAAVWRRRSTRRPTGPDTTAAASPCAPRRLRLRRPSGRRAGAGRLSSSTA